MYTQEQYERALSLYDECGSVTKTMTQLGYPARRQTLYNWITRRKHLPKDGSTFRGVNTPEHPRHPPLELKLDVLHRCFVKRNNILYNMSLPVWRAIFLPCLKMPYSAGFSVMH